MYASIYLVVKDLLPKKPANKRMLICVACGNGPLFIKWNHPKQGGGNFAE